jgi:hypothetical protein
MERCRRITDDLSRRTIFQTFTTPVNPEADGLSDYPERVPHPMDLGTVSDRLHRKYYQNPSEWYSDVELVFQNALDYHPPQGLWYAIAEHGMSEFHRLAAGLNFSNDPEWYSGVNTVVKKLSQILSNPPTPRKANPLIPSLRSKAESAPVMSSEKISILVDRLNTAVNEDRKRDDICAILRDGQGIDIEAAAEQPIDADGLKPLTLNMLLLYLDSQ